MVVVAAHQTDDLCWRVLLVGDFARQQLPHQHSEAVDVGFELVFFPAQYLRSHPVRCPHTPRLSLFGIGVDTAQSEIAQLHVPVLVNENVGRFEVTVKHPFPV